jgi:hypothetical protein
MEGGMNFMNMLGAVGKLQKFGNLCLNPVFLWGGNSNSLFYSNDFEGY